LQSAGHPGVYAATIGHQNKQMKEKEKEEAKAKRESYRRTMNYLRSILGDMVFRPKDQEKVPHGQRPVREDEN